MKGQPYSLLVDGSNDSGLEKLNPLTVKIYDIQQSQVTTQLLDLCLTTGTTSATAESIFKKIDETLNKYDIPWCNCVGFGVDNCSVNLGIRNSVTQKLRAATSWDAHAIWSTIQQSMHQIHFQNCQALMLRIYLLICFTGLIKTLRESQHSKIFVTFVILNTNKF